MLSEAGTEEATAYDHDKEGAEDKAEDGYCHVHAGTHYTVVSHLSLHLLLQLRSFACTSCVFIHRRGHHPCFPFEISFASYPIG